MRDKEMTEPAFETVLFNPASRWLITCDHASNTIPDNVNSGTLGLTNTEMERHIAYDIGAAGVTRHLAKYLNANAILSGFSRLVIDPNRGTDDPTLIMQLYDGTIVPGNRGLRPKDIKFRRQAFYDQYHTRYADLASARDDTVILAVHSFTPRLNGKTPRPWHIGVLYADDDRIAAPLLRRLRTQSDLLVGENEPYAGHLPGDALDRHALRHGRPNVLLEFRQDLITTEPEQHAWARRLAPILTAALNDSGL